MSSAHTIQLIATLIFLLLSFLMSWGLIRLMYFSDNPLGEDDSADNPIIVTHDRIKQSTLLCVICGCLLIVVNVFFETPLMTATSCAVMSRFQVSLYSFHKAGLYAFLYYRVSTFSGFLSEKQQSCLTGFAKVGIFFYALLVLAAVLQITVVHELSKGYCSLANATFMLILGGVQLLVDLVIGIVGLTLFIKVFYCGESLVQLAERDATIATWTKRVIFWSSVAIFTTCVAPVIIVFGVPVLIFTGLDITVNLFCLSMQCQTALQALIYRVLGQEALVSPTPTQSKEPIPLRQTSHVDPKNKDETQSSS